MDRRLLALVLIAGCTAPKGDLVGDRGPAGERGPEGPQGPAGPPGAKGETGAAAALPKVCTPDAVYCDGALLRTCTMGGTDAVLRQDCAVGGSAGNPGKCYADCPGIDKGACCAREKPTCNLDLRFPVGQTIASFGALDPTSYCTAIIPPCPGTGQIIASAGVTPAGCGPRSSYLVAIDRTKLGPGQSVRAPNPAVVVTAMDCAAWIGDVEFRADAPAWAIAVDVTCTEAGKGGLRFTGTFTGSQ